MRRLSDCSRPFVLAGLLLAAGSGCVSSARPLPGPGITPATPPATPPETPAGSASQVRPPDAPPSNVPPTDVPAPGPARPRLPWVNPARCLPSCAYDPGPELVQINRQGEPDPRGRFRVVAAAQGPLLALLQAARAAGHELRVESAFRSYEDQSRVFTEIKEAGRAARPGHSEHQLGTVIDLRLPTGAAIDWLAAHAPEFGFTLSYPPGKQRLTGYRPEPWHIRFVGRELATELKGRGQILEEYFRAQPDQGESGVCSDCPLPASQSACGAVTSQGSCTGTVLSWCYDGALATVDCASSGQQCGLPAGSTEHDCLPKPPEPVASRKAAPQSLAAR